MKMFNDIDRFVNWVRRRNPQAHTWQDYLCDLHQFVAIVGDHPPADITYKDVDDFIEVQAARGLKATTINRRLAAVVSLYTFLSVEMPDLICPVVPHRHSLRAHRRLPRSVPEADLESFFAVVDDAQFSGAQCQRDKAMFLLMLRCGLRISEVAKLRLRDLYLTESPPRLLISGKNSKERSVYLSAQASFALRRYLAERPVSDSEAVFLNYNLNP